MEEVQLIILMILYKVAIAIPSRIMIQKQAMNFRKIGQKFERK